MKPGFTSVPTGAPPPNSYHLPGSFSPAVNGGPPPPTSSPDHSVRPPGPLPPSQYMNGSMGPIPGPGRGPTQPPMPTQPGNMPAAHGHIPPHVGMPPQPGGMPPPLEGMPPQHGGSSFQPLMQPPPTGKSYVPSPVSEHFTCNRKFNVCSCGVLGTWNERQSS